MSKRSGRGKGSDPLAPFPFTARAMIALLRPEQWIKNLFLLAPIVFAERLFDAGSLGRALLAVVAFSLLSSATYIVNDLADFSRDREHPAKRNRPIAAGIVSRPTASLAAGVLVSAGITIAAALGPHFLLTALLYLLVQAFYNLVAKREVILDVMVLSTGYLLRVIAGGAAIDVAVSWWLLLCTFLLALFLSFSKRRAEILLLKEDAGTHRSTLAEYTPYFLDQMIAVVTASTLIAYSLYTIDPEVQRKLGAPLLPVTIPFVLYGIFRYLYLVHRRGGGGDPSRLVLTDRPFLVNLVLWIGAVTAVLYLP